MIDHFILVAAAWGYLASWVNQFVKQDGWPKWANTLVADGVVVLSGAIAVFQQHGDFSLPSFEKALFAAFSAALINHQFFLAPTGIGAALKSATSVVKGATYAPLAPASPAPAPTPPPAVSGGSGLAPVADLLPRKAAAAPTPRKAPATRKAAAKKATKAAAAAKRRR